MQDHVRHDPSPRQGIEVGAMANYVSGARFAAALVAIGTLVSALVLVGRRGIDDERLYVGQTIGVLTIGFGLVAILILAAGWAQVWANSRSGS